LWHLSVRISLIRAPTLIFAEKIAMSFETLLTEQNNGILTITINRPDKLNALNKAVITELGIVFDDVYTNESIHGVILTGSGPKAFVAGADISEFLSLDQNAGAELASRGQELVFNKIENCPKPVVAAVNGFALGGGCELAMACHFRYASENAKFGQPEVNLGLIPGYGGTQRLVHLIGKGRALELLLTANMVDAQEAKRIGLVNEVLPSDQLLQHAGKTLDTIAAKGPHAVAKCIAAVNAGVDGNKNGYEEEIRLFGECFGTEEMKEGVTAFMEKRKANFRQ
jgi:enoyl-CoA hydratase